MNTKILVIDDTRLNIKLLTEILEDEGYDVYSASDGYTAIDIVREIMPDIILLAIMMPGIDGLSMCRTIRETSTIPIIMLSAKSSDLDKIVGLSTGADDYVIKPFNPLELTARVKSQLRRYTKFNPDSHGEKIESEIQIKHLTINRESHKVISGDKEVKLTPIEFDILYLLASNLGKVFSTDEIFERVWNEKMYEANNTVMVHIRRLREKIEMDSRNAQIIKTVWGVGYKIDE